MDSRSLSLVTPVLTPWICKSQPKGGITYYDEETLDIVVGLGSGGYPVNASIRSGNLIAGNNHSGNDFKKEASQKEPQETEEVKEKSRTTAAIGRESVTLSPSSTQKSKTFLEIAALQAPSVHGGGFTFLEGRNKSPG